MPGLGRPFAPMSSGGNTVKGAAAEPASLLGRIGSPTPIDWTVTLPTTSFESRSAAGGTTSVFIFTTLRSDAETAVRAGISRAATTTSLVGIATGASVLALDV